MDKRTKTSLICAGVLSFSVGIMVAIGGCDLDDVIHVTVPSGVVESVGVDSEDAGSDRVSLSEAMVLREEWVAYVTRTTERLDKTIGDGIQTKATIESMIDLGLSHFGAISETVPYGGLLTTALGFGTGLFLRRPGDRKRDQETTTDDSE